MADSRICSMDGCDKRVHARGWCSGHYSRWYSGGDPIGVRATRGQLPRYVSEVVLPYTGDDCLIWPYTKDGHGYGRINVHGRQTSVHRIACEAQNGPSPSRLHEAAHTCGRGSEGCVARRHLVWKTHAENMEDKYVHGTVARGEMNGHAKLSAEKVREIFSMRGTMTHKEIGLVFGVSQSQITRVLSGKRWGHVIA